ncbi:glycine, alanine and asparagine-rich protein-like isoform X2 [Triticum urartu]|uniref:glycine, alanine and asparagine-rich protein-like isoform X2 n=1 Tax=Triticum urartu TaxID=4572 RepID=UPI002044C2B0|nr:glycine, alanine and asparagine-rich protein-like isoform X2 [Triticum urartu]
MASTMRRRADWFLHDWVERLDAQRPPTPTPTPPPPRPASGSTAGRGGASPPSPPRRAPRVPSPPRPSARRGLGQFHYGIQSAAPPHRLQARVTSPADHRNASAFRQGNPTSRSLLHGGLGVFNRFALLASASDYEREFPVLTAATASIDKDAKQRGQSPKAIKHTNGKLRGRGVRRAPQVQHVGTKAVDEPAVKFEGDAQLVIQDASEGAIKGDSEAVIQAKGQTELTKGESEGHAEAGIKAEGHAELAKGESEGHAEASIKAKGHAELAKGESEGHAKAATKAEGHAKVAVKSDKAAPARNVPDLASELNGQDFFVGSILVRCGPPVSVVAGGVEGCRRGGPAGGSGGGPAGGGDGCGGGGPAPDGGGGGVGGGGPADGGGGGGGGGPPVAAEAALVTPAVRRLPNHPIHSVFRSPDANGQAVASTPCSSARSVGWFAVRSTSARTARCHSPSCRRLASRCRRYKFTSPFSTHQPFSSSSVRLEWEIALVTTLQDPRMCLGTVISLLGKHSTLTCRVFGWLDLSARRPAFSGGYTCFRSPSFTHGRYCLVSKRGADL